MYIPALHLEACLSISICHPPATATATAKADFRININLLLARRRGDSFEKPGETLMSEKSTEQSIQTYRLAAPSQPARGSRNEFRGRTRSFAAVEKKAARSNYGGVASNESRRGNSRPFFGSSTNGGCLLLLAR